MNMIFKLFRGCIISITIGLLLTLSIWFSGQENFMKSNPEDPETNIWLIDSDWEMADI